jgi:hypothetical protein
MTDKEIPVKEMTVIEYNPEEDTIFILRDDSMEFTYPGMRTADGDEEVSPHLIPLLAITLLYAEMADAKVGELDFEEELLLSVLQSYMQIKIEQGCEDDRPE